jgi:hypothetical protein
VRARERRPARHTGLPRGAADCRQGASARSVLGLLLPRTPRPLLPRRELLLRAEHEA